MIEVYVFPAHVTGDHSKKAIELGAIKGETGLMALTYGVPVFEDNPPCLNQWRCSLCIIIEFMRLIAKAKKNEDCLFVLNKEDWSFGFTDKEIKDFIILIKGKFNIPDNLIYREN